MTKQILILDDNPSNLKLLELAMRSGGDAVIHLATKGSEAVEIMEKHTLDLLLLDVELPDANGLDLAQIARQRFPSAVLIALSALDTNSEFERACSIGMDAYIVKPFSLPDVLKLIKELETNRKQSDTEITVLPNRGGTMSYSCKT